MNSDIRIKDLMAIGDMENELQCENDDTGVKDDGFAEGTVEKENGIDIPIEYMSTEEIIIPEIKDVHGRLSDMIADIEDKVGIAVIPFEMVGIANEVVRLQRYEIFTISGKKYAMSSDTPVNVMDMSFDEVLKYADTVPDIPSARVRLNYTKMLYDVLGYELTPDIVLASVSEPQAELVISTAGSGKTTWSQIKGISQKLFRKCKSDKSSKISGGRILSIVYNVHNVQDMTTRHAQMVGKLMAANIKGLDIDDKINACTMHSFCDFFRRQYIARLGMLNFRLL